MHNMKTALTPTPPTIPATAEQLFELGIACSQSADHRDLIDAHKWFNLAAAKGEREAGDHRHDMAMELSLAEIAAAQRAARDWLRVH